MNLLPEAPSSKTSHEPLYNIGVVTRMTSISMATLRAWERRYDFPEASRTSGGHRLYSEHDILRLRWVKSRIEEGMQTAQAIQALRHQESTGFNVSEMETLGGVEMGQRTDQPTIDAYQEKLFRALIHRDLQRADLILGEALAIISPEDLIIHVVGPAIAHVGDAWERNEISIAIEHLATNYLRQRLLMWMVSGPPPLPVKPIVLACAPNEWHEGSLLMLGALLRRQRWPIAYLGQAVPLQDLATFTKEINPSAVVIVSMTEETAASMLDWPQWMPEAAQAGNPIICYGGRIFAKDPEWQMKMPGIYLGETIHQGIETLEKLLKS
jgi:MerR family transcriptional regulator, light-induced transcriptional regulator